jgi:uncharacterized membrane protein YkgB
MKASAGIGVVGLVMAFLGALTPVFGLYIGWLALAIVSVAALAGERSLTVATIVLSTFTFLFLTPSLWLAEGLRAAAVSAGAPATVTGRILLPITVVMLAAPIVCIILNASGKAALGKSKR